MGVIRPLAKALTGILTVFASLWGFILTPELQWLFAAIAAVGVINFAIAIHDERMVRVARQQASEDRAILRDLQGYVRTLAGPTEIPAHLQDLSRLTNAQLKQLVADAGGRLRAFQTRIRSERYEAMPRASYKGMAAAERASRWDEDTRAILQQSEAQQSEFNRDLRPDAVAIWEELKRRLPNAPQSEHWQIALEDGGLAGVNPVEQAATELERLARLLGD